MNDLRRREGARVTISDVANRVGVSRQTISNALQHPQRVNPVTLKRVMAAIEELGYQPSSSAQSLRSQRTGAVGIELNTLGQRSVNDTATAFLGALAMRATHHGCHIVPFGSLESEPMVHGYEDMWGRRLVDAFIVADTHGGDPRPAWLELNGIPFATYGPVWDDPTFTRWVDVDGAGGTHAAVDHCRERGYRRIGYLGWPEGSPVGDQRRTGWQDACRDAGPDTAGPAATAEQDLDQAQRSARRLLADLAPGDAVVCASDLLALGVFLAALEAGRRPGADLGIVGFDGSPTAHHHHLTTLAPPMTAIADHILTLVHDGLGDGDPPGTGTTLAPSLAVDHSTTR